MPIVPVVALALVSPNSDAARQRQDRLMFNRDSIEHNKLHRVELNYLKYWKVLWDIAWFKEKAEQDKNQSYNK